MSRRWTALSGTHIGSVHIRDGLPLQDAHAVLVADDTAVIAVADGHGHRLHFRSDVGSALAVRISSELLTAALPRLTDPVTAPAVLREVGTELISRWTRAVGDHVTQHPFAGDDLALVDPTDPGRTTRPYGSTVLAMVATDTLLGVLQIGDGDAVVVTASGTSLRPVPEDPDLDGSRTTSLCQPDPGASLRVGALDVHAEDLVLGYLCTDGFSTSRVDADGWWRQTGEELVGFARQHGFAWIDARLPGWLEEPAAIGGDDTTLALVGLTAIDPGATASATPTTR
ncbi:hypothetical protein NPS01_31440 [Nocardioides psychrotolerans]|uniref:Protein phosphatase 2C n=1 Tax=Nocardioides psychrotolerans TaxID=1005945 RepID=A0A1I3MF64_9ACTN|nr:PP2C family serine/threonine-protein phosphatase [Nocardioides psychrotolerans]GEP39481.1 hypothetical protein NPS01_31440 [Nocardioides psychrotolerans]SFI95603.1 Protein phosphatase 2C [Nocardioides psychrotolerans]